MKQFGILFIYGLTHDFRIVRTSSEPVVWSDKEQKEWIVPVKGPTAEIDLSHLKALYMKIK